MNRPPRPPAAILGIMIALIIGGRHVSAQTVEVCPGQFTGRVRVGRPVLGGQFSATSTSPTGLSSTGSLNGTLWNGVDFTGIDGQGTEDPSGYALSAQAATPCIGGANVLYDIHAHIQTTSGVGDVDEVDYPVASGKTVAVGGKAVLEFIENNPWILDVEVTNTNPDCPTDTFNLFVDARSSTNGNTRTYTSSSQPVTDQPVRRLDMPLLPGVGRDNVFSVKVSVFFGSYAAILTQEVGPADVVNGHIKIQVGFPIQCPPGGLCQDNNLVGTMNLRGLRPEDGLTYTVVGSGGPTSRDATFYSDTMPQSYDLGGSLLTGSYRPYFVSVFDPVSDGNSNLRWPYSTYRNGDEPISEDLTCHETGDLDAEADASFLHGKVSYFCKAQYGTPQVTYHLLSVSGMFEGSNPDGSYIGSYGGGAASVPNLSTGEYKFVLTPGTWVSGLNGPVRLFVGNEVPQLYLDENLDTNDFRPPRLIHLDGGETKRRDFSYEMAKLTVRFQFVGGGTQLRSPLLSGGGELRDSQGVLQYQVSVSSYGSPDLVPEGWVTMYLPKGDYAFGAYTALPDGSVIGLGGINVSLGGCVEIQCTTGCPVVDWLPRADSCSAASGAISGTARDPDGWTRIAYRVNYEAPGPEDLTGYQPFDPLTPTGNPGNEVTFSASLVLDRVGPNLIELEAVDGAGQRFYEQRFVYRSDGTSPILVWTFPPDGYGTSAGAIQVQGSVSSSVRIDAVSVDGALVPFEPPGGTQASFDHTVTLVSGPNTILLEACDVCGFCATETRTVSSCTDTGQTTCGVGACQRTINNCVGGVPQTCFPGSPVTEICNNLDDNCDGAVDEGLGSTTCGVGACQRTINNCVGGVPQTCTPGSPDTEICNDIDDNCDGVIDETCDGFVTGGGQIQVPGGAANFGFNAKIKPAGSAPRGNLNYLNHARGLHVQSESILTLRVFGKTAVFTGTCRKAYGGQPEVPCTFTVTVDDIREPAKNEDRFKIEVSGEPVEGSTTAECPNVGGPPDCRDPMTTDCRCYRGNIQIHFQPMTQALSRTDGTLLDSAPDPTVLTGAGGATYNAGVSFMGVPLTGLRFGMGMDINGDGTGDGDLEITLLGTDSQGQPQHIVIESLITGGYVTGPGEALISSVGSVDMGDGSPPMTGVSVALSLVPGPAQSGLALAVGGTPLPSAAMNGGGLTLPPCSVPAEPAGLTLQNATQLNWSASPASSSYNLYRGAIDNGGFAFNHVCLPPPVTGTSSQDSSVPLSGRVLYYLVSGRNNCGEGSLGQMSNDQPRPNLSPCP